ncbi:SRPBCC domain-containing protein [Solimonas sp. K1W22B-7]|uniref:SRPBCC family protein n=1 Tax=Solimonas sp. K1W22B-7 TaxID=2303331 RepID=UPI000E336C13|nr:SRPBCC domain-containing protein [Solimonas sp. K1W22B-7]AXQ27788.1 SRPBCC domain-containing protein [Solimonas sp. K1W22B-7]
MNDAATMTETREIVVDEVFPHTPDVLWKTLTTAELMGRWLMVPRGFEPVPGKQFSYQTTPAGQWDGVIQCQVLEVVPNERLVYSWQGGHESNAEYGSRLETVVTFTLSRSDLGTRLRLVHSGFRLPKNHSAFSKMSNGWPKVLQQIGAMSGEQDTKEAKKSHG